MRRAAAVLFALGIAGCASLRAEHVLTGTARPPFGGEVAIVMEGAPLDRPYEEIGIVTATGGAQSATLPEVLGALKSEAARLGANAVIRVRYDRGAGSATATGVAVVVSR